MEEALEVMEEALEAMEVDLEEDLEATEEDLVVKEVSDMDVDEILWTTQIWYKLDMFYVDWSFGIMEIYLTKHLLHLFFRSIVLFFNQGSL